MDALAIVEGFNVVKDQEASFTASVELVAVNQFEFEGAPEAFHKGIVVTVAFAAHGGDQTRLGQSGPVVSRSVLDTTIGMEEQLTRLCPVKESHSQSF